MKKAVVRGGRERSAASQKGYGSTGQADDLVAQDVAAAGNLAPFHDPIFRILFHPRRKEDPVRRLPPEHPVVIVGAVVHDERAGIDLQQGQDHAIMSPRLGSAHTSA